MVTMVTMTTKSKKQKKRQMTNQCVNMVFYIISNTLPLICTLGEKCFRKNPQHLSEFSHPHLNTTDNSPKSVSKVFQGFLILK